jgi:hypothetical protein
VSASKLILSLNCQRAVSLISFLVNKAIELVEGFATPRKLKQSKYFALNELYNIEHGPYFKVHLNTH